MHVSIIIPTFNRADLLRYSLNSLVSLNCNNELFEIIVVDNGSTDKTKEVIHEYINNYPYHIIKYYYDDIPGLLSGRHRGANEAKGDILAFIDDDVLVSNNWLKSIIDVFENKTNVDLLTGPTLPYFESYPPNWLNYFWSQSAHGKYCGWLSLIDFGDIPTEIDQTYIWGLNFIIKKSVYFKLKGFHPDCIPDNLQMFQGDGEIGLCHKAKEKGHKAFYHPGVLLYHMIPVKRMTHEYFYKRAYYQGVCDSYTKFRTDFGLYSSNESRKDNYIKNILRYSLTKAKNTLKKTENFPKDIIVFKKKLKENYKLGFDFHQNAFTINPFVKEWVLKDNYLDYKLPK